ncbi:MAG TPA: family 20 glycosylhydrolase [Blastocatellia bacterium]|jgi:hexosaminidase|nr:family 20 glycosylhydrolase [Blastocatellia bacterium]
MGLSKVSMGAGRRILPAVVMWLVFCFSRSEFAAQDSSTTRNLMPVPASLRFNPGRLAITPYFTIAAQGPSDARLLAAIDRMARRLEARTGLTFAREPASDASAATLVIKIESAGDVFPAVGADESYALEVSESQAALNAPTAGGALRGLETFLQLLGGDKDVFYIPAVSIQDKPRFPWRGLMIDVGRHWQPIEVIKRNLDGMAAVKLNVLHLHLTEDQGFRIESKKYPRLHQMGSDGNYYTQAQMREIIEYARMRGIRVVPEFDMPGHTASWFVGYPELASKPGPYRIERAWGIIKPVMDPSNEQVYKFLDGFLGEMAALFPDAYMHIGGDEVEPDDWDENPKIQAFIQEKGLKDSHGLQAYFNQRLSKILTKHRKKMIGWDEILHPDLQKDMVVQSWRGQESLAEAAKQGYRGILSSGYYLDLIEPASRLYLNDPIPENTTLTPEEQKLILGGEATLWAEWVSPETIDSRIWPRMAAIAERFWSPREVRDVDDMYRRLAVTSERLEDSGLLHKKNPEAMLRRWIGVDAARTALAREEIAAKIKPLIDIVEPVKGYRRGSLQKTTQFTPLTRLVDIAQPDSERARDFARDVDNYLYSTPSLNTTGYDPISGALNRWKHFAAGMNRYIFPSNHPASAAQGAGSQLQIRSPLMNQEAAQLARDMEDVSNIGLEAYGFLRSNKIPTEEWLNANLTRLIESAQPKAAVELMIVPPVMEMVIAAAEQEKRKTMSAEEWKEHVKSMTAEKMKQ